jgi:hypothetical protein
VPDSGPVPCTVGADVPGRAAAGYRRGGLTLHSLAAPRRMIVASLPRRPPELRSGRAVAALLRRSSTSCLSPQGFHALRHTYLTLGGRAGIDLRTLQELAGHSTPNLTARYSQRNLYDLAGAVGKLPSFLPGQGPQPEPLRATGTKGEFSTREVASLPPAYRTGERECVSLRVPEKGTGEGPAVGGPAQALELQGPESGCDD